METNENKIVEIILEVENKYPVEQWKIDDIHIWPFIRIMIFMEVIYMNNRSSKTKEKIKEKRYSNFNKLFSELIFILKSPFYTLKYFFWLKKIKEKKYLFVSSDIYRVNLFNKRYNRFFDPIIQKYNLENDSSYLEYSSDQGNHFFLNLNINYINGLFYYQNSVYKLLSKIRKVNKEKINLQGYDNFLVYLEGFSLTNAISKKYSKNSLEKIVLKLSFILTYQQNIINRIKPKTIFTLSYYNDQVMMLNHVAYLNNIEVIEMQHGPISDKHLAYGLWTKVPTEGYSSLPTKFWCWDINSKLSLDKFICKSNMHQSFVGGHPWVEYWKTSKNEKYELEDNIILVSLQHPFNEYKNKFTSDFIDFIKKSDFKWYFRMHPAQMYEKEQIVEYFREMSLFEQVEIEKATDYPLPILLNNTLLHITTNSGTTIEASLMNKPTLLLDELGKDYYSKLIKDGIVTYLNPNESDFILKLKLLIDKCKADIEVVKENQSQILEYDIKYLFK